MCFTRGLSSKSERNTQMPSTMDVRSFGSIRIQSSSNQRLTASNRAALSDHSVRRLHLLDSPRRSSRRAACPPRPRTSPSRLRVAVLAVVPGPRHQRVPSTGCPRFSTITRRLFARNRRSPSSIRALQLVRVDDVLVNLEQRHVVVQRLVQQDHELHQVRARLLPERLLARPNRFVISVAMPYASA